MIEFDSTFLCGLIKTCRPKKILEVGVATGSSTAIILQVLQDIGEPYETHSVDISEKLYTDQTQPTGYLAAIAKENKLLIPPRETTLCGKHEFHLGKYLPQIIDEIGDGIDFVFLDTVHFLPGEVLDFLVTLPYLKDGAMVGLHDIEFCQFVPPPKPLGFATGSLFSAAVSEEKFLNSKVQSSDEKFTQFFYPNIGAFRIGKETRANIENVFLALVLTWAYRPGDNELDLYRDFYSKHYSADMVNIFNEAVRMNSHRMSLPEKK